VREDVKVSVDLEAEDTLAVRLRSLQMEGSRPEAPVRDALERQTRAILDRVTYLDGSLALIEVDGVSNAVLIRAAKPVEGRFVQVVLRNGNSIKVEGHGAPVHLSRENYEKLREELIGLLS